MATVGIVKAIVTADISKLKKGIDEANSTMTRFGKNMTKVGKSLTMKVTMPLAGLGFAAGKAAADFEFSMTQIETLVGRSRAEVKQLTEAVLGLSGETGRAPKELADAMFFITSAGLDAASATAALEMSAKAAAVGLGDTAIVADAVTNAMNGYGMSADGAAFATDVLAKTVEQGKASAADLAPQFGRLIPMAAELGISFDQVGGGLAFLTRSSGDAALSATQLGGVMKSILKPSQQALRVFDDIGLDLHELRAAASTDLLGALQDLRERLEENGLEMSNVFEDIRGLNGALMLTGKATGTAREVFDQLADSTGKLDEAFEGVQKTAQFKLSQAMAEVKASLVTLGNAILPVVVPIIRTLASVIGSLAEAFGNLSPGMRTAVIIFGVVATAAGPVLMVLGSLTTAITTLATAAGVATVSLSAILGPIALIAAAGVGLFMFFSRSGGEAKEAAERVDLLTQEMVEAGGASQILSTDIDGLTARLVALGDSADESVPAIEELNVGLTLMQELLSRGVRNAFDKHITNMDHHNRLIEQGSDDYQKFAKALRPVITNGGSLNQVFSDYGHVLGEDEERIRALVDAGKMEVTELIAMMQALDETADAHDDLREKNQETAEAFFESAENVEAYEGALAASRLAIVEAALAEGDQVRALELVIGYTKSAEATVARLAAAEVEAATATEELTTAGTAWVTTGESITDMMQQNRGSFFQQRKEAGKLREEYLELVSTEQQRKRHSSRIHIERLEEERLTAQALQFEYFALLDTEQARKRASSANWAVNSGQLIADNLGVQARQLMTIRDLEAVILGTRQASTQEAKDATKNVISLLRADRQIRMTEKAINALLDERNELLGLGTDDDAQSIEQMQQQQDAITDVERALIDMGSELDAGSAELDYLTEAQARANDITGEQAQSLRDATRAVYEAQGAYDAGYGSVIELAAAQERLAAAHESIFTGAQDVADAEERLVEIDEALTTAAEDLALQELAVNDAQRLVAESGDAAYAAADSLSTMFRTVLGPSAVGVSDNMNELARSLVEEADKVFPEFDAMRKALEGITFGMTDEQIDGYVRSVTQMVNAGQGEVAAILATAEPPTLTMMLERPSTATIQEAIDGLDQAFIVAGQVSLPAPDTTTMLDDVRAALANANLRVDIDVVMASVDPDTAATMAWLQTEGAHNLLGIPWTPMAHGGIVTSPTLAMIGEAGPEAVIPLGQGGGMGGSTHLTVNVEGSVIAEADLTEMIQTQLIKVKRRNASLQFT
jgi:TP901 family phage tail tape measure protein